MTYRYTLEGYSSGVLRSKLLGRTWNRNEYADMEFPIEAYRKLCKRLNLQFPLDDVADSQTETSPQPKTLAPDDQAIIEGLTVADVRAMCAHSAPLKSILIATANWHKIPNGYQQKRDDTALRSHLNQQAMTDCWGTSVDNGVAKDDLNVLVRYITGNVKGRGKK